MWASDWLAAIDDRFMDGVLFLKEFQQSVVRKTELPFQEQFIFLTVQMFR